MERARSLDAAFAIRQPANLHVTGCSNSCAQHYIGDFGLIGVKVEGEEGYQVNLGGGADSDQGLTRELFAAMKYTGVRPALQALFKSFQETRLSDEDFLHFTRRHEVEELRAMCTSSTEAIIKDYAECRSLFLTFRITRRSLPGNALSSTDSSRACFRVHPVPQTNSRPH